MHLKCGFSKKLYSENDLFRSRRKSKKTQLLVAAGGRGRGALASWRAYGGNHGGWMESMVGHVTVWWECGNVVSPGDGHIEEQFICPCAWSLRVCSVLSSSLSNVVEPLLLFRLYMSCE